MHSDRCGNSSVQECNTKGSRTETKIHEFMCRDTANVEREMYDYTGRLIIGTTGMVTKGLKKNLEAIPGKQSIDSLRKTAVLGTSHIIGKYCSLKLEA